ncbi:MAG: dipeptidase [Candidatus Latescibacteria bacterium]|nr:dipeptidase [Candidatus Latescibacterota bacterium]
MNEAMQRARDTALRLLQPSGRDLQYGLDLHAESVVCDTYGFAPRAALDGQALSRAAEEGASAAELAAMREEMGMTRMATDPVERREFESAWKAAGVTCVFQNAGEEGQAVPRLMKRLARFTYTTDILRDLVSRAVWPEDVEAAKKAGRHCLYLSGNGVPLPQDWVSVEEELGYIGLFYQLGIRMMHLTYNRRNMIGDGCAEPSNAGLSDFGRAVVAEMNRVGVLVDVAHCGWQTSLEAAQLSERPMVASHSVCCALHSHVRGKPDPVIRAIVDSGGYIGICCIPAFLGGRGDITALLDHVDHVARTFGADHVTIGTDRAYSSTTPVVPTATGGRSGRPRWEYFWPPNTFGAQWEKADMVESLAWTNWPLFTVGLVQRGYSDEDIRRIIGGNMLRVLGAVRPQQSGD